MAPKRSRTSRVSSCSNPLGLTQIEHIQRYEEIVKRVVKPTRVICEDTFARFGILEDIQWLFSRLHMGEFIRAGHPTYSDLTREFLSTVTINFTAATTLGKGIITFRLGRRDHQLSVDQLNELFDFSSEGVCHHNQSVGFQRLVFWEEIAGRAEFNPSGSNASCIRNPVLRIAHKVLANTIFGRVDVNTIRVPELLFLWSMIEGREVNVGSFLAQNLVHVAGGKSAIVIGSIVTHLAMRLNVPLENYRIEGAMSIERMGPKSLMSMKVLRRDANKWFWVHPNGLSLEVTHTLYVTVRNRANLSFDQWHGQNFDQAEQPQEAEPQMLDAIPFSQTDPIYLPHFSTTHGGSSSEEGVSQDEVPRAGPSTSHPSPPGFDFSVLQGTLDSILQRQDQIMQNQARFQEHIHQQMTQFGNELSSMRGEMRQWRDEWPSTWTQWGMQQDTRHLSSRLVQCL